MYVSRLGANTNYMNGGTGRGGYTGLVGYILTVPLRNWGDAVFVANMGFISLYRRGL